MTPRSRPRSLAIRRIDAPSGLRALVAAVVLAASPSAAFDPPPADTVAAVAARVGQTVETLETVAAGVGLDRAALEGLAPCEALATSRGEDGAPGRCADGLVHAHAELER